VRGAGTEVGTLLGVGVAEAIGAGGLDGVGVTAGAGVARAGDAARGVARALGVGTGTGATVGTGVGVGVGVGVAAGGASVKRSGATLGMVLGRADDGSGTGVGVVCCARTPGAPPTAKAAAAIPAHLPIRWFPRVTRMSLAVPS
jgi:hypothetical protein